MRQHYISRRHGLAEQTQTDTGAQSLVTAHKLAAQYAVQEETERQKRIRQRAGLTKAKKDAEKGTVVLDDGRVIEPMATFRQSPSVDCTAIPKGLIKSDEDGPFMTRWVRKVDDFDQPSDREIVLRKAFGYEIILRDGEPLTLGREFIAMQAPAKAVANWIYRTAKPGSTVYDRASESLEDEARAINKKAGRRVVEIVTGDEHGHEDPSTVMFAE